MKKNYSYFLSLVMVTILSMMSLPVMAGNKDYYSKATAKAVGAGKVYVNKSTTNNPTYSQNSTATNSSRTQNPPTHTYYLYAQADEGNTFEGWYLDVECSTPATTTPQNDGSYSVQFTASSTNQSSPESRGCGWLLQSRGCSANRQG